MTPFVPPSIDNRFRLIFSLVVTAFGLFGLIDIIIDWRQSRDPFHLLFEVSAILFSLVSVAYLWTGFRSRMKRAAKTIATLEASHREFRKGNEEILQRMRGAIKVQFARWGLTPAETRLAEALMRGYTIGQIAAQTSRSPNTVRNQTAAVYAKAGMTGRSDLSAFFLADVLGDEETDGAAAGHAPAP